MQRDGLSEVLASSLSSLPNEFASKFVQYTAPSENRDLLRQQLDAAKQQLEDEKRVTTGWWRCITSRWSSSRRLMPGCGQSRTTPHWRGGRMTGYRYVVEITAAVDSSGTEQTFYVGSTGFTTLPTDTPAGTAIPPHLLNPGNYERSLFTGKRTFGAVSGNYGEVVIANHKGPVRRMDRLRIRWPSIPLVLRPGRCGLSIRLYDGSAMHDAERGFRAGCSAHQVARPPVAAGQAGNQPVVRRHRGRGRQRGSGGLACRACWATRILFRWSCWITGCNCISFTRARHLRRRPCPQCTTAASR